MEYAEAVVKAGEIKAQLEPYCERIEIAGSIRRKKPFVKDVEIVCIRKNIELWNFNRVVSEWKRIRGSSKGKHTQRIHPNGASVDIFMVNEMNWGLQFAIRTGSADYSHYVLARGWERKGYHSVGGILYTKAFPITTKMIREEHELFALIGIPWCEPEKREL